jgi:hypothetical protein
VSPRRAVLTLLLAVLSIAPTAVLADTFRLVAPDGTVHYTNAPTDPKYQRMGFTVRAPGAPAGAADPVARDAYVRYIREASNRYGVPEKLVTAVIRAESGFNPRAVSPKGAQGLMQLMPQTASTLGVRNSFDPAENIDGGVRHLRGLIEQFRNLPLALAAYNAGAQAVTHYGGIPPYPETQGYVQKVLAFFNGGGEAGVTLAPVSYPIRRHVTEDGTIVYSNLPPAALARLLRR